MDFLPFWRLLARVHTFEVEDLDLLPFWRDLTRLCILVAVGVVRVFVDAVDILVHANHQPLSEIVIDLKGALSIF